MRLLSPSGRSVEAGGKYPYAGCVGRRQRSDSRVVLDGAAEDSAKCPAWGGAGRKIVSGERCRAAAEDSQGAGT